MKYFNFVEPFSATVAYVADGYVRGFPCEDKFINYLQELCAELSIDMMSKEKPIVLKGAWDTIVQMENFLKTLLLELQKSISRGENLSLQDLSEAFAHCSNLFMVKKESSHLCTDTNVSSPAQQADSALDLNSHHLNKDEERSEKMAEEVSNGTWGLSQGQTGAGGMEITNKIGLETDHQFPETVGLDARHKMRESEAKFVKVSPQLDANGKIGMENVQSDKEEKGLPCEEISSKHHILCKDDVENCDADSLKLKTVSRSRRKRKTSKFGKSSNAQCTNYAASQTDTVRIERGVKPTCDIGKVKVGTFHQEESNDKTDSNLSVDNDKEAKLLKSSFSLDVQEIDNEQTFIPKVHILGRKRKRQSACKESKRVRPSHVKDENKLEGVLNKPITSVANLTSKSSVSKSRKTLKTNGSEDVEKIQALFSCVECSYHTQRQKQLEEHVKRVHLAKPFGCPKCYKEFGIRRDLRRHMKCHGKAEHSCDVCGRRYKEASKLKAHKETHASDYVKPQFSCEQCSKSFSTKYVLAYHIKSEHLGMKPSYICQKCGKSFTQKNSYLQHANLHQGVKPFSCSICHMQFSYKKSLKEHSFLHEDVKNFKCSVCNKSFRQPSSLNVHMRIHKGTRDYICSVCGKEFSQRQALVRHERIHAGEKPFECCLCSRFFGDSSVLRRHMISVHKKSRDTWHKDTRRHVLVKETSPTHAVLDSVSKSRANLRNEDEVVKKSERENSDHISDKNSRGKNESKDDLNLSRKRLLYSHDKKLKI